MRVLTQHDAARTLAELMVYVNDSGESIKIVKAGGVGACVLMSYRRVEKLQDRIKQLTGELEAYRAPNGGMPQALKGQ